MSCIETLRDVSLFDKPKYAFCLSPDGKYYQTTELLGVGRIDDYEVKPTLGKRGSGEKKPWFKFLYVQYGVLWVLDEEGFILLHDLPSDSEIAEMVAYLKEDKSEGGAWYTTEKYYGEVAKLNLKK